MGLLEYKNMINYISRYQIAFEKIFRLINEIKDFQILKKTIKITF